MSILAQTLREMERTEQAASRLDVQIAAGKPASEAEAMPARILRGLLREAIEKLIPEGALAAAKVAEASERAGLRLLAARCAT